MKNKNFKYYKLENGGVVKLENNVRLYSLDENGNWIPNQYFVSIFYDSPIEYEQISEEEVLDIITEYQKKYQ